MHAMCNRSGKKIDAFLLICRQDAWEANQARSEEAGREGVGVQV